MSIGFPVGLGSVDSFNVSFVPPVVTVDPLAAAYTLVAEEGMAILGAGIALSATTASNHRMKHFPLGQWQLSAVGVQYTSSTLSTTNLMRVRAYARSGVVASDDPVGGTALLDNLITVAGTRVNYLQFSATTATTFTFNLPQSGSGTDRDSVGVAPELFVDSAKVLSWPARVGCTVAVVAAGTVTGLIVTLSFGRATSGN